MRGIKKSENSPVHAGKPVVPLVCACANLRRATRIVTHLYEDEMRSTGLRSTQFTLLQALSIAPGISQGHLGEILGLDSTTLTRTLELLRKRGWVQSEPGQDRREVKLSLTAKGRKKFESAKPRWQAAQNRLRKSLGEKDWEGLMALAVRAAAIKLETRLKENRDRAGYSIRPQSSGETAAWEAEAEWPEE